MAPTTSPGEQQTDSQIQRSIPPTRTGAITFRSFLEAPIRIRRIIGIRLGLIRYGRLTLKNIFVSPTGKLLGAEND